MAHEIKFNQLLSSLSEQVEGRKEHLRSGLGTMILYVHLYLYALFMTLLILKYFKII